MSNYHFSALPDSTSFTLYLPDGKRLMGRGDVLSDSHYHKYLMEHKDKRIYGILERMIPKYGIHGEALLMVDGDDGEFQYIKGDVAHLTNAINTLFHKLVDSYCCK